MKYICSIALLIAASGVSAQTLSSPGNGPQYTTVDVYESCTDTAIGTDTVTSTVIQTTCPLCTNTHSGSMVHITVYTTVYQTLCSTGLTDQTYTITETCTGPTPTWPSSMGPTYMPPGFTQTVTLCTVCNSQASPTSVTITVPCGSCGKPTSSSMGPLPTYTPPSSSMGGTVHGPTTTTTTVCPGSTLCHHTTSTTSTMTSRSSVQPYTAGAMPTVDAWAHVIGGAIAAAGVVLF
jgi:hypothetical protein